MSANQATFPVAAMARVLGVSKAGFYAWLHRPLSAHAEADEALLKRIKTVHASSRQTYGAPRVHAELRNRGRPTVASGSLVLCMTLGLLAPVISAAGRQQHDVTRMRGVRPIWSIATSLPPHRTSCGRSCQRFRRCSRWKGIGQYTSVAFGKQCGEAGVRPSMGSVGDAYDNAMAESFFSTLEAELLNRRRFTS